MSSRSTALLIALVAVAIAACSQDPQKLKQQYFEDGNKYAADKKYEEAVVQYRNAILRDPRFGEAHFKLAEVYAEMGDLNDALREYIRAADSMPDNVDAQLRAGNGLLGSGQYAEAKARALAVLAKEPRNVAALILLGNCLAGMKDLDGAITQMQDAVDADPRQTLSYANLGAAQMAKGDRLAAEKAFKAAVVMDPKSEPARLALANYYWVADQRLDAERELKAVLDDNPKSVGATRALAVFYGLSNRKDESEQYLKAYAELAPGAGPKIILADFYLVGNKNQEALAVLKPLQNTKEGFVPASLRLAALDFAEDRKSQAYQTLDEALKREPKNEDALLEKARFLLLDGKPNETLVIASVVTGRNPNSAAGHYLRGMALKSAGSKEEAAKAFQDVLKLRPAATAAQLQLADLSLARGDTAAAVAYANQAITIEPNSGPAHLLLGTSLLRMGNLARAETEILGLAKANPSSVDSQLLLGEFYSAKGDVPRSREAFERALTLQPGSVQAVVGLVKADLAQKKPDAARARIDAQLATTPDDESVLLAASATYLRIGDAGKAESTLRHLLQVNPSNAEGYNRLGGLYLSQRRLDEARKEYEIAASKPETAIAAATMLGMILGLQNNHDEARKQYERVLAIDPQMPVAANNLAWDYVERGGNLDVALQLAQTAKLALPNVGSVSDTLGWIFYRKGLTGLAVTSLQEAATQAPTDPSIRYRLGLAYLKNGDEKEGRAALEQALKMNPQFPEAADARLTLTGLKG